MRRIGNGRMQGRRLCTALIILLLCGILICGPATAMKNPSAVYCEALGYHYVTITTQDGGEAGQCQLSATEKVSAWKFLQGEVSPGKGYCAKQGYQYQKVTDPEACKEFGLDTCMVCVLADGKKVEVTKLMNLSFEEGVCGDGRCTMAENTASCAQDCPSGGSDGYCDGMRDGKCDTDCPAGGDADCKTAAASKPFLSPAVPWIALVAVGGAALLFARKRD
jgi:putative hemolysin